MRDRLTELRSVGTGEKNQPVMPAKNHAVDDAVSALIALGYKPQEASRYVHTVAGEQMGSEEIIRQALKASVSN